MKYFQCKLQQNKDEMTSWIEERGAKKGAIVEVHGAGKWTVIEVYGFGIEAKELNDKQKRDRDCLPSIRQ